MPDPMLALVDVPAVVLRWPVIVTAGALLVILIGFRARNDLADRMGLKKPDIALLTMGAIAAPALNVPVAVSDGTVFAVNLGGAIVPLLIVLRLRWAGGIPGGRFLLLLAAVAAATWMVVRVDPGRGIVAGFPGFLLPAGVAFVGALLLTGGDAIKAGPLAFAGGALGALVGADVLSFPALWDALEGTSAGVAVVLGGGGAFDLIFVSGAVGLGACLFLALAFTRSPGGVGDPRAPPRRVPDARRVIEEGERLGGLSPREQCLRELARANVALEGGRLQAAVEHACRGVDAVLASGSPRLKERVAARGVEEVSAWLGVLSKRRQAAARGGMGWVEAADTVEVAKRVSGALWAQAGGRVRLGGRG